MFKKNIRECYFHEKSNILTRYNTVIYFGNLKKNHF